MSSFDFQKKQQWTLPQTTNSATAFILENKQVYNIENDGDSCDYIEFILPHARYGSIFNLSPDFQDDMND